MCRRATPSPPTRSCSPETLKTADFHYDLPSGAIAQEPLAQRDASRLLVLDRATGAIAHRTFGELPSLLRPGDLLVTNRSRVFPARLVARRPGGGAAEVLLVSPRSADGRQWSAWLRPGRRIRRGDTLFVSGHLSVVIEEAESQSDGRRQVSLQTSAADGWAALDAEGRVPLPPYIKRGGEDRDLDRERYQTVFARERGSVAAPTAGLHFSAELLRELEEKGIERAEVVLHVGPGTFQPVKVEDVSDHRVAAEPYQVPEAAADAFANARRRGARIVAVGTTSVRTLETAAVPGHGPAPEIAPGSGETSLVIYPPYQFRATDALITNFHLPRSSLLLLVAAFAGRERVLAAYREAIAQGYRFYSYGDAMLIL